MPIEIPIINTHIAKGIYQLGVRGWEGEGGGWEGDMGEGT